MRQPHIDAAIRRILGRRSENVSGPCPDDNELAAFLEARLAPDEEARLEAHAADCAVCRETLALAVQLNAAEESAHVAAAAAAPQKLAYRTSPVRLVFAAAVVVVVGALLFQATRQTQPPAQKPQIAEKQNPENLSGGPGAAMSSKETRPPETPASMAANRMPPGSAASAPSQVQGSQPAPRPAAVTVPSSVADQLAPERGNLVRVQAPANAQTFGFAAGENAKADALKNSLVNADNRALNKATAGTKFEEAKAKAGATSQTSGQIAQVSNLPAQSATLINQQAALDQLGTIKPQAAVAQAGRAGTVVQPAADERKRAEPDQKVRADQPAQAGKGAAQAVDRMMLAYRSPLKDAGGDSVRRALEEARVLQSTDPGGKSATKIGQRLFYRTPTLWVDAGCLMRRDTPVNEVLRSSKEYEDIIAKEPDLAQLLPSGLAVLILWKDANYLIR